MNTTFLSSTLSPAAGGMAASIPALVWGLAARGQDVQVVGLEDPANPEAAQDWGPEVHSHVSLRPRAFGYALGLEATLSRLAPDVVSVHGLWTYPSLANFRYHRRTGTPYIITPHGMLDPWARARSAWKKRIVRLWFENAHLRGATCLHATAEMEAGHFRSFGLTNPIALVPNGVDVPHLVDGGRDPDAPRRLLFLSRLHPKKGLDLLLRAWGRLASRHPNWELVIAGPDEGGHKAEMQALAHRFGLRRLIWMEPVQGAAKTALYESADLFVLPTHAENFGLVVAEALAHGVPVITTRNAPWEGLVQHRCGWWVPLDNDALTNCIDSALSQPVCELNEMGRRGRDWMARDFGWNRISDQMLEVLTWVRHGGTPPQFVHQ